MPSAKLFLSRQARMSNLGTPELRSCKLWFIQRSLLEKKAIMLRFNSVKMRYEPFPLAVLRPALEVGLYEQLVETYPPTSLFAKSPKYDYKLTLSEKFNADNYHRFISETPVWKKFHAWLKSDEFILRTVEFLKNNNVDLGVDRAFESSPTRLGRTLHALSKGRLPNDLLSLRTRFEFSVLKADGGEVAPHTDTPKKIITLVMTMIKDNEWKPEYGGGLDVNRATDSAYAFNWNNRMVPWEKIEILDTIPFVPNQCTVFVKTFNSLHSVRKMTQTGSDALRKTITIVIEHDE